MSIAYRRKGGAFLFFLSIALRGKTLPQVSPVAIHPLSGLYHSTTGLSGKIEMHISDLASLETKFVTVLCIVTKYVLAQLICS